MSQFSNPAGRTPEESVGYVKALLDLLGDRNPLTVQGELVGRLTALTAGLADEETRRPEAPGKWSILQVLEHLTDQETVAAYRLRSVIAEDEPALRGYDQDRWTARLRYGNAPAGQVLAELTTLRARNLRLYGALDDREFERVGLHSERGRESARRLCELTAAHDLVHRRQIARIRTAIGKPFSGAA
jgi:hypothetical protein